MNTPTPASEPLFEPEPHTLRVYPLVKDAESALWGSAVSYFAPHRVIRSLELPNFSNRGLKIKEPLTQNDHLPYHLDALLTEAVLAEKLSPGEQTVVILVEDPSEGGPLRTVRTAINRLRGKHEKLFIQVYHPRKSGGYTWVRARWQTKAE